MKKRFLIIPLLSLMFCGAVACSASYSVTPVHAEDEITEVIEEPAPEEESKYKELYEDAINKIKEIKESQFMTSLIGALSGGLGSMIISLIFMFVNRDTMRKCLNSLRLGERTLNSGIESAKSLKETHDITNDKLEKYMEIAEEIDKRSLEVIEKAEKVLASQESNNAMYEAQIDSLLTIISNTPELVANGTAEKLNKIYRKK